MPRGVYQRKSGVEYSPYKSKASSRRIVQMYSPLDNGSGLALYKSLKLGFFAAPPNAQQIGVDSLYTGLMLAWALYHNTDEYVHEFNRLPTRDEKCKILSTIQKFSTSLGAHDMVKEYYNKVPEHLKVSDKDIKASYCMMFPHQSDFQMKFWDYINHGFKDRSVSQGFSIIAPRQTGKSILMVDTLVRFASLFQDSISIYILLSFGPIYEQIKSYILQLDPSAHVDGNLHLITFSNGARVQFISAEMRRNIRGLTLNGLLIVDEAAFIPDEWFTQIVLPFTNVHKPPIIYASTPFFKQGVFYEAVNHPDIIHTNFKDFDLGGILTPQVLNAARSAPGMTEQRFKTEYLAEWADDTGDVFHNIDSIHSQSYYIDEIDPDVPPVYYSNDYDPDESLVLGIDFGYGSGKDYTSLSGLNLHGHQVLQWFDNHTSPTRCVDFINKIISTHKVDRIGVETANMGTIYYDMIKRSDLLVPYQMDHQQKVHIIESLASAFEGATQLDLKFLNLGSQKLQFTSYIRQQTPSGRSYTYNASRPEIHDDAVISLAIAHDLLLAIL